MIQPTTAGVIEMGWESPACTSWRNVNIPSLDTSTTADGAHQQQQEEEEEEENIRKQKKKQRTGRYESKTTPEDKHSIQIT